MPIQPIAYSLVLVAIVASKALFSDLCREFPDDRVFHFQPTVPDFVNMLDNRRKSFPILQICPCPSQTIRDIYDFEFSLLGKIWNGWKAVKSPIVWDFPRHMKTRLTIFADQDTMLLSVSQTIRNRVQMIRDAWVELELPRGSRDSHGSRDSGGYFHMTCTVWPR